MKPSTDSQLQAALIQTDFSTPRAFSYSFGIMTKVHDMFTFPEEVHLSKLIAQGADAGIFLTNLLVQSRAGAGGGHYYAFRSPGLPPTMPSNRTSGVTRAKGSC